jgi:acyl carrier protein
MWIKKFSNEMKEMNMTNKEKYDAVFIDCFSVKQEVLNENFIYNCIPAWDSVGHMGMISALEEAFNIMMDTEDIIEFGSYTIGIEKLKKYNVEI